MRILRVLFTLVLILVLFGSHALCDQGTQHVASQHSVDSVVASLGDNVLMEQQIEERSGDGEETTYGPETDIGPIVGWHITPTSSTGYIIMLIVLAVLFFRIVSSKIDLLFEKLIPRKYHFYTLVPESAWLILLGVVIGFFMWLAGVQDANELLTFDAEVFFLFLIPPIILHAGYFLDQRFFFQNIWLILLYAMLGTLLSCIVLGSSLYGVSGTFSVVSTATADADYSYLDLLLYGALISAIDPVAVLAIFEELHVNETLNILVFGESVLNDAVSIVLYRLFEALRAADYQKRLQDKPLIIYILLGVVKFLYVSIGGVAVGVIVALACAFTTKFTSRVQRIEPMLVILFGFLAYFLAESLVTSGIMSILFCGLVMARYVELNVEKKSHIVIKWTLSAVGVTAENVIFIYLGISLIVHTHVFDLFQILFTIVFMMIVRFILVFTIGSFDNYVLRRKERKKDRINFRTMFVIAFGGLRGAIAFALSFIIPQFNQTPSGEESWEVQRRAFITSTLVVILFTVFLQGSMMRPLLKLLKIRGTTQTEKQLKEDLKGEQDFLHHEEKEISQAVEKIEYLEKSVSILPECAERQDFIDANTKVMRNITQHIIMHVDNIIADLEKMNANIRKLMELDAKDKKNPQSARDIINWRLTKAQNIRVSWRAQLDEMDISQRYRSSKNVNDVIQHLRGQLFQLSKKPTKLTSESDEEEQESGERRGSFGKKTNTSANGNKPRSKIRRRKRNNQSESYEELISNFDPVEFEETSFVEILHLHDMLEFGYDSYHTVTWARDDDFLFFLDRTLLLESLKSWNDYAEEMLRQEDVSQSLLMLRYLRKMIHIQIQNRLNELTHLKKEAFADKVLGFGIKRAQPIALSAARAPTISRRIQRVLRGIDNLIQKVVVRGLHSEEQKLIFALRKIRKDEMEEVAYHDINLAYDELVQHNGIKKLTEKTLKKEADTLEELLVPSFLRMLHLKENPSQYIRDELSEYKRERKRHGEKIPRVSSVSWDPGTGKHGGGTILDDESTDQSADRRTTPSQYEDGSSLSLHDWDPEESASTSDGTRGKTEQKSHPRGSHTRHLSSDSKSDSKSDKDQKSGVDDVEIVVCGGLDSPPGVTKQTETQKNATGSGANEKSPSAHEDTPEKDKNQRGKRDDSPRQ